MVTKKSTNSPKKEIKSKAETKKTSKKIDNKESYENAEKDLQEKFKKNLDILNMRKNLKKTFLDNFIDIDSLSDDEISKTLLNFSLKVDPSEFKDDEETGNYIVKYFMIEHEELIDKQRSIENSLLSVMEKKEKETKFGNVLKAFDYVGWIALIWVIVIVFKGHSDVSEGRRILLGVYLIWWIISVVISVCKNTDVAKNTNKLMRTIINSRRMLHKGESAERVENELNLQNILDKK